MVTSTGQDSHIAHLYYVIIFKLVNHAFKMSYVYSKLFLLAVPTSGVVCHSQEVQRDTRLQAKQT